MAPGALICIKHRYFKNLWLTVKKWHSPGNDQEDAAKVIKIHDEVWTEDPGNTEGKLGEASLLKYCGPKSSQQEALDAKGVIGYEQNKEESHQFFQNETHFHWMRNHPSFQSKKVPRRCLDKDLNQILF
jgi:hypothetical protein